MKILKYRDAKIIVCFSLAFFYMLLLSLPLVASADNTRFTILSDLTVKDNTTGLIWTRNANLARGLTWTAASNYINQLNKQKYGGYNDWRFPTVHEFVTLVDYSHAEPALPSEHPFINVQMSDYWTSDICVYYKDRSVWAINLMHGNVKTQDNSIGLSIWLVRKN
ncbi:MAG: DUF1566 domain-containing protein [Nitrospirae bacterium]|nr:DUF1566 domain-containing protein [Nitrospirota bacterium]